MVRDFFGRVNRQDSGPINCSMDELCIAIRCYEYSEFAKARSLGAERHNGRDENAPKKPARKYKQNSDGDRF